MPELPDVEVFRQYVDATALHKPIRRIHLHDADRILGCSATKLRRHLKGSQFEATERHGKQLGIRLDSAEWLLLHFGMTGFLDFARNSQAPPASARLVFDFEGEERLAYMNQRKLGRVDIAEDFAEFIEHEELGPDALEVERESFTALLSDGKGTLKTRLMNQQLIAGLGNVYVDETLFQAGVRPQTDVSGVSSEVAAEIWRTLRYVLRTAIDRRAQPEDFPDTWLTPHRADEQCPRCRGQLRSEKIGGRTTWYCPACQS